MLQLLVGLFLNLGIGEGCFTLLDCLKLGFTVTWGVVSLTLVDGFSIRSNLFRYNSKKVNISITKGYKVFDLSHMKLIMTTGSFRSICSFNNQSEGLHWIVKSPSLYCRDWKVSINFSRSYLTSLGLGKSNN